MRPVALTAAAVAGNLRDSGLLIEALVDLAIARLAVAERTGHLQYLLIQLVEVDRPVVEAVVTLADIFIGFVGGAMPVEGSAFRASYVGVVVSVHLDKL